ncbi:MAG: hypothetical protein H7839_13715 [Magnetococcus sp. YQC-5]
MLGVLRWYANAVPISNGGMPMADKPLSSVHPGRDISPILIRQIAKDIIMDVEVFLAGPTGA